MRSAALKLSIHKLSTMAPRVIPRPFTERLILYDIRHSSAASANVHENRMGPSSS